MRVDCLSYATVTKERIRGFVIDFDHKYFLTCNDQFTGDKDVNKYTCDT